jgi:predicted DNA-binding WGR domain protein
MLAPTLFGEWSLIREWGRIGQPGTVRVDQFTTEEDAMAALAKKAGEKERRGYRPRG